MITAKFESKSIHILKSIWNGYHREDCFTTLISKPELGSSYFPLSICQSTKLHNESYAPNMTSNGPQEPLKPSQETESLVRRLAGPSSGKAGFVETSAAGKLREF